MLGKIEMRFRTIYCLFFFILLLNLSFSSAFVTDTCSNDTNKYLLYDDFEGATINTSMWVNAQGSGKINNTIKFFGNSALSCSFNSSNQNCLKSVNSLFGINTSVLVYVTQDNQAEQTLYTLTMENNRIVTMYSDIANFWNYDDGAWKSYTVPSPKTNTEWHRLYWYNTASNKFTVNISNSSSSVQVANVTSYNTPITFLSTISIGTNINGARTTEKIYYDRLMVWNRTIYGDVCPQDIPANPLIKFVSQNPNNFTSNTLFSQNLSVSYNYTMTNLTSYFLNYTVTSNSKSCIDFINGSCSFANASYRKLNFSSNLTKLPDGVFNFTFSENDLYPFTTNLNFTYFNVAPTNQSLTTNSRFINQEFLNVTTSLTYNIFEIMAISTSNVSKVYVCNSTYSSGTVTSNVNCQEIGTLKDAYNHAHSVFAAHQLIPFIISNGKIGGTGITATPTMRFMIAGDNIGANTVSYVNNFTRTAATQTSLNSGLTWSDEVFTTNSHLYQYTTTEVLSYQAVGYYNLTYRNSTAFLNDLIEVVGLFPTSPIITNPLNTVQSSEYLNISWLNATATSPGATILYYNVSLLNSDLSFNKSILANASLNNSVLFNVYVPNMTIQTWYVRVETTDSQGLKSSDTEPFNLTRNALVNITVKDRTSLITLVNYTINVTDLTNGEVYSVISVNLTNTTVNIIKGHNYNFSVDKSDYSIEIFPKQYNSSTYFNDTLFLFFTNSVTFNMYDIANGLPVLQTLTILLNKGNFSLSYITTSGTYFASSIPEGVYTVSISSSNYSTAFFTLTMTNRTTQTINSYLSSTFSNIGIYTKSLGGDPLYQTDITIQQLINGSYVSIANKKTDILGFALFQLVDGTNYRFTMTPTGSGFETKTFLMETYAFNQPYTITFSLGGLQYYTGFASLAAYHIFPNVTTQENKSISFGMSSYSINGTILYTSVNCSDGSSQNISGFPNGATTQITTDLSNFHGVFYCRYVLGVDTQQPLIIILPYFITGITSYNNSNLAQASTVFKNELNNMNSGSGSAWMSIIAIFIILVAALTAHQLSAGMSKISTITALAGVILFAYLGWLPFAISAFIVIIGGFLVFYREAF